MLTTPFLNILGVVIYTSIDAVFPFPHSLTDLCSSLMPYMNLAYMCPISTSFSQSQCHHAIQPQVEHYTPPL
jgi:hypothetical protein